MKQGRGFASVDFYEEEFSADKCLMVPLLYDKKIPRAQEHWNLLRNKPSTLPWALNF